MSPYPSSVPWCQSTPLGRPVVPPVYQSRRSSPERSIRGAGCVRRAAARLVAPESARASSSISTRCRRPRHAVACAGDPLARANGGTRAPRRRRSRRAARARRPGSGSSRSPAPRAASSSANRHSMYSGQLWRKSATLVSGPTPSSAERRRQARGAVLDLAPRDPPVALHDGGRVGDGVGDRAPTPSRSSRTRRRLLRFGVDACVTSRSARPCRGAVRGRRPSRRATTRRSRRTRRGRRWRTRCPCP